MIGVDPWIGPQLISVFVPLGLFCAGVLWLALQRRPHQ